MGRVLLHTPLRLLPLPKKRFFVREDRTEFVPGLILDLMQFFELIEDLVNVFGGSTTVLGHTRCVVIQTQLLHFRILIITNISTGKPPPLKLALIQTINTT